MAAGRFRRGPSGAPVRTSVMSGGCERREDALIPAPQSAQRTAGPARVDAVPANKGGGKMAANNGGLVISCASLF